MSDEEAASLEVREHEGALRFSVRVQPRASREAVKGVREGALEVALTAPPVDGEANAALIAFLAKKLRVARRDVTLLQGETSRTKVLAVRGVTREALQALTERG